MSKFSLSSLLRIFAGAPKGESPGVPTGDLVLPPARVWGSNADGTKYVVGLTVADLKNELARFSDTDEVCMAVCPKKYWNGGGLLGKLKGVEHGSMGQVWLKALVLDESLE